MLDRCRRAQIKDKDINLNLETSPARFNSKTKLNWQNFCPFFGLSRTWCPPFCTVTKYHSYRNFSCSKRHKSSKVKVHYRFPQRIRLATKIFKTVNSNEASCEKGILHNHCSENVEPNSKDNSEIFQHYYLLRGSTDFFFLPLQGETSAIKTVNSNEASCEKGILHNHCSDNVEPNSKDNSEIFQHCYLLRGSTDFFFLPLQGETFSYQNCQFERS